MFVSINHISVTEGRETDFEELWRTRDRSVEKLPGFVSLDILQPGRTLTMKPGEPPVKSDNVYMVLTRWESQDAFNAWVGSDAFKKAHGQKRSPEGLMLEHPRFHGWEAVELGKTAAAD